MGRRFIMKKVLVRIISCFLILCLMIMPAFKVNAYQLDYQSLNLLSFKGERQMVLGDFDKLGRATFAHIQLQDKDEPEKKREPRIQYNPKGWHNYKMIYNKEGKKAYLFNRGHLIGYQFCGLTDEGKNLVQLTAWTNSGKYQGLDSSNNEGMLYYEQRLDNWLRLHPNYWLDYRVTPIYSGDELVPRQISLQYVGIDASGQLLEIKLGSDKEKVNADRITTVVLDNYSKNANINYLTGTAEPSLVPTDVEKEVVVNKSSSESTREGTQSVQESKPVQETNQQDNLAAVVYIARNGKADVYWYSKSNMPSNTNFSKVIEMSEKEALDIGKRHTSKE